jgi:hypothetical protein
MSSTAPLESRSAVSQRLPLFVAQPLLKEDGLPKIERVFIANRGEIACRVIATCRKLSLTTIAIFVQEWVISCSETSYADMYNQGQEFTPCYRRR